MLKKYWNRRTAVAVLACAALLAAAAVGFASEGGEGAHHVDTAAQMKDFMWRWIDFGVLVVIVVWALKKADLKKGLSDRRENIAKLLNEAVAAREAAEAKMREYSAKLENANKEIEEIAAAIRKEGEAEKVRIIAEANAGAEKIKEQARVAATQEIEKARAELREEAARLAVELAATKIRENLKKEDQDRLVAEYLSKVVELH